MWGQRENLSNKQSVNMEKGMNFASVAAAGALGAPAVQPPKYLEPAPPPPQVIFLLIPYGDEFFLSSMAVCHRI